MRYNGGVKEGGGRRDAMEEGRREVVEGIRGRREVVKGMQGKEGGGKRYTREEGGC